MADTTHLQLPLLAAAQAQKHVTHNDALLRLDAIVQLSVKDRDLTTPPAEPSEGDRYVVASGGTGAWAGWDDAVAWYVDGAWVQLIPRAGWIVWTEDEEKLLIHNGTNWTLLDDAYVLKSGDTMTGALQVPDGSEAEPGLALGAADTGLYADGDILFSLGGVARLQIANWGIWHSPDASIGWSGIGISGDVFTEVHLRSASNDALAPLFQAQKSRGTLAAPELPVQNDNVLHIAGSHWRTGSTFTPTGEIKNRISASSPSSSDLQSRWEFWTVPASSITSTETARIEHATGLSMYGTNPVIDEDRHFNLRSYTVATLPSADPAGMLAFVTDSSLTGSQKVIYSDGTNWRFIQNGNVVS